MHIFHLLVPASSTLGWPYSSAIGGLLLCRNAWIRCSWSSPYLYISDCFLHTMGIVLKTWQLAQLSHRATRSETSSVATAGSAWSQHMSLFTEKNPLPYVEASMYFYVQLSWKNLRIASALLVISHYERNNLLAHHTSPFKHIIVESFCMVCQ